MQAEVLIPYALFFVALFAWGCYFILVTPFEPRAAWIKSGNVFRQILTKKYPQLHITVYMSLAVKGGQRVVRLFTITPYSEVENIDVAPAILRHCWLECNEEGHAIIAIELLPDDWKYGEPNA